MAAYAALVSLINNIEQIKIHPRVSTLFDRKQLESLLERVDSLLVFIESCNSSGGSKDEAKELETQIASAAHSAEDVIENHIVDQILPDKGPSFLVKILEKMRLKKGKSCIQSLKLDLQKIVEDMDSVKEKVMKVKGGRRCKAELPYSYISAASSTPRNTNMVGFEGYLTQLLEELTGDRSDRQIIPIVGMGGIGKTTLARNAYDNLLVVHHFDVRAWVTVSQTFDVTRILVQILCCLGKSKNGMDEKTEHELGEQLHKTLSGMRYLIVLDDMWSVEVWDEIKFFFPNNCNRSRIIVTTRIVDVAARLGSMGLSLDFLDDDHSWKLFCDKVFPNDHYPLEFGERGKKIVRKCRGLPLAIVVIGGLLGSISRTKDQWENVERNIASILNTTNDNQCLNLLSLSYSHLPACLKPCFLYLGIFPEDDVIHVSRLVKLWVAEGFIKPNKDQSLEEIAESYVEDLVDRNLIYVNSLRWNGKVKTFCIHDLLRDLCIRVAEKEKLFCITSELGTPDWQRRIIIRGSTFKEVKYNTRVLGTLRSKSLARSLILKQARPFKEVKYNTRVLGTLRSKSLARSLILKQARPFKEVKYNTRVLGTLRSKSLARSLILEQGRPVHVKSRLLRVLVRVYSEPRDVISQQVNLRFLDHESYFWMISDQLPSSISLLWNVQTLIMTGVDRVCAPSEIWKMPQLRHLMCNILRLPEPPPASDGIVLHNLQTLVRVKNFKFREEVCNRMPNIKKLHVYFGYFSRDSANFTSFNKLESLHYQFDREPERHNLLQSLKFPNSLKKLTLKRFTLQWEDLTVIGSLPHLEVLILKNSIRGTNWDPVEGEFRRLKLLRIDESDLVCWNAGSTHFPVLENLVLDALCFLNEIPSGIGDIQTLGQISLAYCSDSSALSAVKILEEQQSLGNEWLQVKLRVSSEWREKDLMEQMEAEGLTGLNFQLDVGWRN